jgi:hypothetical protein
MIFASKGNILEDPLSAKPSSVPPPRSQVATQIIHIHTSETTAAEHVQNMRDVWPTLVLRLEPWYLETPG